MEKIDSDFIALQELASRIEKDPNNAGWYMHRAYLLGQGHSISDVFEMPPRDYSKPFLSVIDGGKGRMMASIHIMTERNDG